ncbi:hypothetical protein ERJ75_000326800 [Trypanosoma vivax]|nr:putative retrotransposon hot spot (RHS) protein [Trypanosoma vivax]KAH8617908.1 hypothetical protein ERJ75_000326800 [Trypanosoma vivax]
MPPFGVQHGIRAVSWGVVAGYAIVLSYRLGLLQRLLPRRIATEVDNVVQKVKAVTEPVGGTRRYLAVRRHLVLVYTTSAAGMLTATLGGAAFCACPQLPIVYSIILTVLPSTLLLTLPRDTVLPVCRLGCFFTSCFAFGYSFGPVAWVTWDLFAVFTLLLGSSMCGLILSLFLTRGMASYVFSSQLFSCALSTAVLTSFPVLPTEVKRYTSHGVRHGTGLYVDVSILVFMQFLSNGTINLLHTLPTIVRFVKRHGSEEHLLLTVDFLKESLCICGGAAYLCWSGLCTVARRLISVAPEEKRDNVDGVGTAGDMALVARHATQLKKLMRDASPTLLLLAIYIRTVLVLQEGSTIEKLEALRCAFRRATLAHSLLRCFSSGGT